MPRTRQAFIAGAAAAAAGLAVARVAKPAAAAQTAPQTGPPPPGTQLPRVPALPREAPRLNLPRLANGLIAPPPGIQHPAEGLDVLIGDTDAEGSVQARKGNLPAGARLQLAGRVDVRPNRGDVVVAYGRRNGDTFEVVEMSVIFTSERRERA